MDERNQEKGEELCSALGVAYPMPAAYAFVEMCVGQKKGSRVAQSEALAAARPTHAACEYIWMRPSQKTDVGLYGAAHLLTCRPGGTTDRLGAADRVTILSLLSSYCGQTALIGQRK
eukprot:1139488-Pelagomonas_calceolata.AAC.6